MTVSVSTWVQERLRLLGSMALPPGWAVQPDSALSARSPPQASMQKVFLVPTQILLVTKKSSLSLVLPCKEEGWPKADMGTCVHVTCGPLAESVPDLVWAACSRF